MDDVLSSEFRAVFRLSLLSRDNVVAAAEEAGKKPVPVLKDLINSILFTRRLVPTYIAVLVIVICLSAVVKRLTIYISSRQRGRELETQRSTTPSVASSSSSTLQGTESPPLKLDDAAEDTALIEEAQHRRKYHGIAIVRLWHYIRSFLLRQPRPIPALTSSRNTLPANEVSLVILLFLLLNVFYVFYQIPFSSPMVFAFADRAGLLFVANLPVLYVLAAKNNQPLQYITGWSYEGLNIFHRRLGEWMIGEAIIHTSGMVIAFYQLIAPSGYTLGWYLTRHIIILGVLALLFYLGIYFTSIGYFRQALYELFLAVHIFLQVGALALLFFHHHDARPYVGAAVTVWALDRLVTRMMCKTKSFVATLAVAADKETVMLYCEVPLSRWKVVGMEAGWHAGQHVFLTVPSLGALHRVQAHPFTIASPAPPRDARTTSWPLQLTIRAQDGFSRELLNYARLHQHTRVYMDGPYSSNDVVQAIRRCDRLCLVAGGSGIAVTYPFAWDRIVESTSVKDVLHDRTLYLNGRKQWPNIEKTGVAIDGSRFAHFWVRQDAIHDGWVTMLPRANNTPSPEAPHEIYSTNTGVAVDLITNRFDTRSSTGEHQRPDIKSELDAWVRYDLKQKIDVQQRICVVVSGPDGLVRDMQNGVANLVREGWNVEIHVEKFGW